MSDYVSFLEEKSQFGDASGFKPSFMPDQMFDFQKYLTEWALVNGRGAGLTDCGTGKTLMELVWAENVVRETNKPVLLMTPNAVSAQTVQEGDKFGIEAVRSKGGVIPSGAKIVVSNYEQLHHFNPNDFIGFIGDEASGTKSPSSKACFRKTKTNPKKFWKSRKRNRVNYYNEFDRNRVDGRPLAIDLYIPTLSLMAYGIIKGNGDQCRPREMGARVQGEEAPRAPSAWARGRSKEARSFKLPRAQIMAFHDDQVLLEQARPGRLASVSRARHYSVREMAGVPGVLGGYGAEADTEAHFGPDRFGRQL